MIKFYFSILIFLLSPLQATALRDLDPDAEFARRKDTFQSVLWSFAPGSTSCLTQLPSTGEDVIIPLGVAQGLRENSDYRRVDSQQYIDVYGSDMHQIRNPKTGQLEDLWYDGWYGKGFTQHEGSLCLVVVKCGRNQFEDSPYQILIRLNLSGAPTKETYPPSEPPAPLV